MFEKPNIGSMLAQVNLGQMIEQIGVAIGKAQLAMDAAGVELLEKLLDHKIEIAGSDGRPPVQKSLLELGFVPTFYGITEVTLQAKVALSATASEEFSASTSMRVGNPISFAAATVDASYSNKYSFSAEASSSISAKFVALPPPAELRQELERIRGSGSSSSSTSTGKRQDESANTELKGASG